MIPLVRPDLFINSLRETFNCSEGNNSEGLEDRKPFLEFNYVDFYNYMRMCST